MYYYFDNAATTAIKPESVSKAVYKSLHDGIYGNPSRGSHDFSLNSFKIIYEGRKKIAEFFNSSDDRGVVFTSNITMSLNMVIQGLLTPDDHVITTAYEHNSVLRPLYMLEKEGLEIGMVGFSLPNGRLNYNEFKNLLKPNTKMVLCTHGSNVIGNLIDLKRVGKFCKENDLLFVVDTAQTAGVFPIDMQEFNIDILCFTGHKSLFGPQGTGGIVINENLKIKPTFSGGSGTDSFSHEHPNTLPALLESGTMNTHGVAGLIAGLDYINDKGILNLKEKQQALALKFYEGIKHHKELDFCGDYENDRSAIVAFNIKDIPSSDIADVLNEDFKIAVRGGAHCAPRLHEHMGTKDQGIVRFSFSSFNSEEEIDYAISVIDKLVDMANM